MACVRTAAVFIVLCTASHAIKTDAAQTATPSSNHSEANATYVASMVTIGIKSSSNTFCAQQMLTNIRQYTQNTPVVLVVERSGIESLANDVTKIIQLEEDAGLAKGRNEMLKHTDTPYLFLLDDDFLFDESPMPGLQSALTYLERHTVDILGGCVDSCSDCVACSGYSLQPPTLARPTVIVSRVPPVGDGSMQEVDMVDNFFVGRTSVLREIMWDPFFKIGEHEDFFLRAHGTAKVGFFKDLVVRNSRGCRPVQDKSEYDRRRGRVFEYWKFNFRKWRYTTFQSPHGTYKLMCGNVTAPASFHDVDSCYVKWLNPTDLPWGSSVERVPDNFPSFATQERPPLGDGQSRLRHLKPSRQSRYRQRHSIRQKRVALVTVATGKHIKIFKDLKESADKFFLRPGADIATAPCGGLVNVHHYVFTDCCEPGTLGPDVTIFQQGALGFPYDSLFRFEMILDEYDNIDADYIYCIDVDTLFVGAIGTEILGDLLGTINAFYYGMPAISFPFDRNPRSPTYMPAYSGTYYFAGGLFGGSKSKLLRMLQELAAYSSRMLNNETKYLPPWHDESMINYYFHFVGKPTVILGPDYLALKPPADTWLNPIASEYMSRHTPKIYNLGVREATVDKGLRSSNATF